MRIDKARSNQEPSPKRIAAYLLVCLAFGMPAVLILPLQATDINVFENESIDTAWDVGESISALTESHPAAAERTLVELRPPGTQEPGLVQSNSHWVDEYASPERYQNRATGSIPDPPRWYQD